MCLLLVLTCWTVNWRSVTYDLNATNHFPIHLLCSSLDHPSICVCVCIRSTTVTRMKTTWSTSRGITEWLHAARSRGYWRSRKLDHRRRKMAPFSSGSASEETAMSFLSCESVCLSVCSQQSCQCRLPLNPAFTSVHSLHAVVCPWCCHVGKVFTGDKAHVN